MRLLVGQQHLHCCPYRSQEHVLLDPGCPATPRTTYPQIHSVLFFLLCNVSPSGSHHMALPVLISFLAIFLLISSFITVSAWQTAFYLRPLATMQLVFSIS